MASADVLDVHFIAGNRSELDLKFRAVVAAEKSPDETMSDFIKRAVIERFDRGENLQQESLVAEKVRQELLVRIRELEEKIQSGYTCFDIMDDNEKFCRGIMFDINELGRS